VVRNKRKKKKKLKEIFVQNFCFSNNQPPKKYFLFCIQASFNQNQNEQLKTFDVFRFLWIALVGEKFVYI